jgi:hypothetical protein
VSPFRTPTPRRLWLAVVSVGAALAVTVPAGAAAPATAGQTAEGRPLRVLAVGDSFAAGEGLTHIQTGEAACQRALGRETSAAGAVPSRAWPVQVVDTFSGFDNERRWDVGAFWFAACTGNTSVNFRNEPSGRDDRGLSQFDEAVDGAGSGPWDVLTVSFGGNDIGFSDIIRDCIGLTDAEIGAIAAAVVAPGAPGGLNDVAALALTTGAFAGCSQSEEQLKGITESVLAGPAGRLAALYDQIADVVAPGALVVVTGYPQLVASPDRWPVFERTVGRCHRLSPADANSLRGATGYLNQTIGQAVADAGSRHPDINWLFVDVNDAFENGTSSNNLCGGDSFINGFPSLLIDGTIREGAAVDAASRAFHPNQAGHDAYARIVASRITGAGWTPAELVPPSVPEDEFVIAFLEAVIEGRDASSFVRDAAVIDEAQDLVGFFAGSEYALSVDSCEPTETQVRCAVSIFSDGFNTFFDVFVSTFINPRGTGIDGEFTGDPVPQFISSVVS